MAKLRDQHSWEVAPEEARRIQELWRDRVVVEDRLDALRFIAGADAEFDEERGLVWAAVVVLELPGLEPTDAAAAGVGLHFPYVPGLLAFREAPALLGALDKLTIRPDLLICDGHGIAHPRRFGLASHVGVLADLPTVGVAKTRLTGAHEPVPDVRGAWRPIVADGEIIGAALRTRCGVKPAFVSVGHRVTLSTAVDAVLQSTTQFRLPEPIRYAHREAAVARARG